MTTKVKIENFEVEHDENLLTLTYEYDSLPVDIKEALKFIDGHLSWKNNDLLWTAGDKEIEFKNVSRETLKAMGNKDSVYMVAIDKKEIKHAVRLLLPEQKKIVSKMKYG